MIRLLTKTELNKIIPYLSYFQDTHPTYEDYEEYYVYENPEMIGFCKIQRFLERAEVDYLYVFPRYQNHGIGTFFLNEIIHLLKHKGVKEISLEVNEKNKPAIALYQKCHFQIVSIRKNYYSDGDAYLMYQEVL